MRKKPDVRNGRRARKSRERRTERDRGGPYGIRAEQFFISFSLTRKQPREVSDVFRFNRDLQSTNGTGDPFIVFDLDRTTENKQTSLYIVFDFVFFLRLGYTLQSLVQI